jgi:hypothetical protein
MNSAGYLLSILLLGLSFLLKLFIDRRTDIPIFINAILELPVDINFVGLSFTIAFIIKDSKNIESGLITFCCYLLVSIITVFLWRKSGWCFEKNKIAWTIILALVNLFLSSILLLKSLELLIG